jgi:predicted lipoprotein with Yx(FWY)xxD motif
MEASTMRRLLTISGFLLAATALVGCSSTGATPTVSAAPASPTGPATVEAESVGDLGTVLVAGSNRMTVYIFTKDVKDSGASACTGECLANWPALTVPAGSTPSGGSGVTGTLGTITRTDDGTLQVTYNGLPLYFFINDKAPGDSTGVYENWEAVTP